MTDTTTKTEKAIKTSRKDQLEDTETRILKHQATGTKREETIATAQEATLTSSIRAAIETTETLKVLEGIETTTTEVIRAIQDDLTIEAAIDSLRTQTRTTSARMPETATMADKTDQTRATQETSLQTQDATTTARETIKTRSLLGKTKNLREATISLQARRRSTTTTSRDCVN